MTYGPGWEASRVSSKPSKWRILFRTETTFFCEIFFAFSSTTRSPPQTRLCTLSETVSPCNRWPDPPTPLVPREAERSHALSFSPPPSPSSNSGDEK